MRIWKFPLKITDIQSVLMPMGAKVLTAQFQHGCLFLWALCDEKETVFQGRYIRIIGTGNPVYGDVPEKYIATAQQFNGELVWHVFEE